METLKNIPKRYIFTFLATLCNLICYVDRTNLGVVILEFNYSSDEQGFISSGFFAGYLLTQIPGGYLSHKFGGKWVLIAGVVVWTIMDVLTIPAYNILGLFIAVRFGMGLGEGVNFPSLHSLQGSWVPKPERSLLVAIISGGSDLGTIIAFIITPRIINAWGWRWVFVVWGTLAGIWVLLFSIFASSKPEEHPSISPGEKDYILSNRSNELTGKTSSEIPWKLLLKHKGVWAIMITHFCANYTWYVMLTWLPKYFKSHLGIDLASDTIYLVLPYISGWIGMQLAGYTATALIQKNIKVIYVRKLMVALGTFGPTIFLVMMRFVNSAWMGAGFLSCTLFLGRMVIAGYWVNMIDLGPKYAGHIMALSNTVGTIPGILGNSLSGVILQSNNWDLVFIIAAGVSFLGGVVYLTLGTADEIQDPDEVHAVKTVADMEASLLKDPLLDK